MVPVTLLDLVEPRIVFYPSRMKRQIKSGANRVVLALELQPCGADALLRVAAAGPFKALSWVFCPPVWHKAFLNIC